jgi:predicted thioesterase
MDFTLPPNLTGAATTVVVETNTALALGSGSVPVYATPALVALLEQAAVDALASYLPAGMTTVGVRIDVQHLAATPVGLHVQAQATLRAQDGRKLTFEIVAHDDTEKVAEAIHQRVLVDQQRFLLRAASKAGL